MYRTMVGAVKHIYSTEGGATAFYKGLAPSVFQIIPYAGLTFAFYSLFQGLWRNTNFNEGMHMNKRFSQIPLPR